MLASGHVTPGLAFSVRTLKMQECTDSILVTSATRPAAGRVADVTKIESVQRSFTKRLPGLSNL